MILMRILRTGAAALTLVPALTLGAPAATLDGTDIAPAIAYFGAMVSSLAKPVTIFNWSDTAAKGDESPGYLHNGRAGAGTFWNHFGAISGRGAMYGAGLYAAVDPVITAPYGVSADQWRLLVIQLKKGLRVLDFQRIYAGGSSVPADVAQILAKFQCPLTGLPEVFFANGGRSLTADCQRIVRRVFRETLAIDAFAYSYSSSGFRDCSNAHTFPAFVLLREEAIDPGDYHFLTAKSTKNPDERIMIQTLFLKIRDEQSTGWNQFMQSAWRPKLLEFLSAHPGHDLQSTSNSCSDSLCTVSAKFCDSQGHCETFDLGQFMRPGGPLITDAEAKLSSMFGTLWADLIGKPKATTTSVYLKNNVFGCDGNLPYDGGQ